MKSYAKILLFVCGVILTLFMAATCGCKTVKPSVVDSTVVSTNETKKQTGNTVDSTTEKTTLKPASRNSIEFEPSKDSSGNFVTTKVQSISGEDTLTVRTEGKKIKAESNCTAQINYWKREVYTRDSLIEVYKSKDSSHTVTESVRVPYPVEKIVKETPWYVLLIIGAMALAIVYLLISKIFRK